MLILALVCSIIATPDRRDCVIATALHHEFIGQTEVPAVCLSAGEAYIAAHWRINEGLEYPKVMCVRRDINAGAG